MAGHGQGDAQSRRTDAAVVAALFAVRFALCVLGGAGRGDESWFLRVVDRVTNGETLYRDVFFGSTPLAVQAVGLLARIGGAESLAQKAVWAAASAAGALACIRAARRLGVTANAWLLALPFVVWPLPDCDQVYGTLSLAFLYVALAATLASGELGGGRAHLVAGLAAGLSFAAKPNVGCFALAAVVAGQALLAKPDERAAAWLRRAAVATVVFVVAAAVPLVPVALSGGWTDFAHYVFLNKTTYLRVAGESWFGQVGARMPWRADSWPGIASHTVGLPVLFLLPLAAAALLVAILRADARDRRRLLVATAFVAAAAGYAFPRANFKHQSQVMGAALFASLVAWNRLAPAMAPAVRRGVRGAAIAFTAASAVWLAAPHVRELVRGRARLSDLPHFTGVLTSARAIDEAGTLAETLAEEARAGRRPFVCAHQAGFWQLVSGIPNPTPFDYTMNASFGPTGQAAVIAAIVDGRIGVVWLDPDMPRAMRPTELEDYIRSHLVRDGSAGDFEVWRARR